MEQPEQHNPPEVISSKINETWASAIANSILSNMGTFDNQRPQKTKIHFRNWFEEQKESSIFYVPVELLRFRPGNCRVIGTISGIEAITGKLTDNEESQKITRDALEKEHPEANVTLMALVQQEGQNEPAIITADGILVDGNRRKLIFEKLQKQFPNETKYNFIKVAILPGNKILEIDERTKEDFWDYNIPTATEIDEIEAKYQLHNDGKAEYSEFNKTLAIRKYIRSGRTLETQLQSDSSFTEQGLTFNKEKNRLEANQETLETVVESYLKYIRAPRQYQLITWGGLWTSMKDIYKLNKNKMSSEAWKLEHGISTKVSYEILEVLFNIVRSNPEGSLHNMITKIVPKILVNKEALKIFLKYNSSISKKLETKPLKTPGKFEDSPDSIPLFKKQLEEIELEFQTEFKTGTEIVITKCETIYKGSDKKSEPLSQLEKSLELLQQSNSLKHDIASEGQLSECLEYINEMYEILGELKDHVGTKKFELVKSTRKMLEKFS